MRTWGTLLVAAALIAAPTAAHAVQDDNYTPVQPSGATLAGSVVTGECRDDESWLEYEVMVTDPDATAAPTGDVVLLIETAEGSVPVRLGPLSDGSVAGTVPWPAAASADAATTVNASIQVQSSSVPALAYPITVPACAPAASAAGALAVTGTTMWTAGFVAFGGALVAVGTALFVVRLRRQR